MRRQLHVLLRQRYAKTLICLCIILLVMTTDLNVIFEATTQTVLTSYLVYEYLLLCLLHESLTIGFRHVDIMCCSSLEEVIRGTRHIGTYSSLDFFSACKMIDNIFNSVENIYFFYAVFGKDEIIRVTSCWYYIDLDSCHLAPGLLFIAK